MTPTSLRRLWAIALGTYREAIRNRVLYALFLFAALVVGAAATIGSLSIGDQRKFIADFGLATMSLFTAITAALIAVNLLNSELRRRTIFNVLSKPVRRWEFLAGKYAGLLLSTATVLAIMAALFAVFYGFAGGSPRALAGAVAGIALESAIVGATALFFSAVVVTPALAGMLTAAVYVIGRSTDHLRFFFDGHGPAAAFMSQLLYYSAPHLARVNAAGRFEPGDLFLPADLLPATLYAGGYATVLLVLAAIIFERRQLDL
jgi:ABC-type Na+ efflux pump permease subunit